MSDDDEIPPAPVVGQICFCDCSTALYRIPIYGVCDGKPDYPGQKHPPRVDKYPEHVVGWMKKDRPMYVVAQVYVENDPERPWLNHMSLLYDFERKRFLGWALTWNLDVRATCNP